MSYSEPNLTREHRLIELIKQITAEKLIGDDCAVLPGNRLVSSDMLVEGKHFLLPQTSMEDLGWKAMAVNISDIAAMGGEPQFALVNIAMPSRFSDEDFQRLFQSMQDCARQFGTRIIGGDLTGSESLVISITILGQARGDRSLMRGSALPGDVLIVTGDFGASALGLELIRRSLKEKGSLDEPGSQDRASHYLWKRHCRPSPRVKEAQELLEISQAEAACMDSSDGLADALLQIAASSKVSIIVDAEKIPLALETISKAQDLSCSALELALYGGEDYELVATVRQSQWELLSKGGSFKAIGTVVSGKDVVLKTADGDIKLDRSRTFQHWLDS